MQYSLKGPAFNEYALQRLWFSSSLAVIVLKQSRKKVLYARSMFSSISTIGRAAVIWFKSELLREKRNTMTYNECLSDVQARVKFLAQSFSVEFTSLWLECQSHCSKILSSLMTLLCVCVPAYPTPLCTCSHVLCFPPLFSNWPGRTPACVFCPLPPQTFPSDGREELACCGW